MLVSSRRTHNHKLMTAAVVALLPLYIVYLYWGPHRWFQQQSERPFRCPDILIKLRDITDRCVYALST